MIVNSVTTLEVRGHTVSVAAAWRPVTVRICGYSGNRAAACPGSSGMLIGDLTLMQDRAVRYSASPHSVIIRLSFNELSGEERGCVCLTGRRRTGSVPVIFRQGKRRVRPAARPTVGEGVTDRGDRVVADYATCDSPWRPRGAMASGTKIGLAPGRGRCRGR